MHAFAPVYLTDVNDTSITKQLNDIGIKDIRMSPDVLGSLALHGIHVSDLRSYTAFTDRISCMMNRNVRQVSNVSRNTYESDIVCHSDPSLHDRIAGILLKGTTPSTYMIIEVTIHANACLWIYVYEYTLEITHESCMWMFTRNVPRLNVISIAYKLFLDRKDRYTHDQEFGS